MEGGSITDAGAGVRRRASFRDPAGFCVAQGERMLRWVDPRQAPELLKLLEAPWVRARVEQGQWVSTRRLSGEDLRTLGADDDWRGVVSPAAGEEAWVLEHPRVPWASYPYEWPAEMLVAAGELTLDLALTALGEGANLKDATPYNVLFRGPEPVFIDVASLERRDPHDPVWTPYAQFVRTFLLPLLAQRRLGWSLRDVFLGRRDGLEPAELYAAVGPVRRWLPPLLGWVTLPKLLAGQAERETVYQRRSMANAERARFVVESTLRRLRRALQRLAPSPRQVSVWSGYMESHSYDAEAFRAKEAFVRQALDEFHPASVLDVGANTGHFSRLAAAAGARVVAVDLDAACVGAIWRQAREQRLDILPLIVDLARPSPGVGWRNGECPAFLERMAGRCEGVLMLALIHHLLVTERIPLAAILDGLAALAPKMAVLEFVAPADPMFRRLTRGRDELHAALDVRGFEAACRARFNVVRSLALPGGTRTLFLLHCP